MKKVIFLLVICISFHISNAYSQNDKNYKDTMNLTEFWKTVIEGTGDSVVKLEHIYVTTKDRDEQSSIRKYLSESRVVEHEIEVRDIYFEGYFHEYFNGYHSGPFNIDSSTFKNTVSISIKNSQGIFVNNCVFEEWVQLETDGWLGIKLSDSKLMNGAWLFNRSTESNRKIRIENTSIFQKRGHTWIAVNGGLHIRNSKILPKNNVDPSDSIWVNIEGEITNIDLEEDTFKIPVVFSYNSKVSNTVNISNCDFYLFSLENLTLPENHYNVYIKWNQIKNRLAYHVERFEFTNEMGMARAIRITQDYYSFSSDSSVLSEKYFDKLVSHTNQLYSIYKTQGDLQSSNQCYADLKKFETKRWKLLFHQNKSFESFFRWQLNSFLSYFTDYGTNPAKAVIKSGWVILLFSIFYLFFPSDWDVSNRSQLLSKIKDLASKNRDKSFMATLGFVAYSGFIHILNAITLSLNAFTTLGFGDIPTHGAARYVTIVQGFIGWFLLTIFSVSLINQVLG